VSERVRESNERIAEKAIRLRFASRVPFICECSEASCREFILLHPSEYLERSEHGDVVLPGHPVSAARPTAAEGGATLEDRRRSA
jgi:hypothetical protein